MAAVIGAIGLTILTGTAGQLSLAHAFFVAVGAYGYCYFAGTGGLGVDARPAASACRRCSRWSWPSRSPGSPARSTARSPAGCAASTSASRRSAWSSSASTSSSTRPASRAASTAATRSPSASSASPSARATPSSTIVGVPFEELERLWYLGLALVAIAYVRRRAGWSTGRPGRALETVRDSEVAAAVMGVDVTRYKAAAFTVSSMYAGLAGVLLALIFDRIVPESFGLRSRVEFLAMIVIGGLGSIRGAVLGAIFVSMLPQVLDHYSDSLPFIAQAGERRRRGGPGRALRLRRRDRRGAGLRAGRARRRCPHNPRGEPHERSYVAACWRSDRRCLLAVAVGACGKAGDDNSSSGSGGVKTGPGVTAKTITIGQLTDLSGVFAPVASAFTQAQELYFKQQNAAGRRLRAPGQARHQGHRLRRPEGGLALPRHGARRRRHQPGRRLADHRRAAAQLREGQHAHGRRRVAAGAPRRQERRDRRRDLRPRGHQRHRVDDGEQGPQEGRHDRRPLLRGRLRRGRPDRRQARGREARPRRSSSRRSRRPTRTCPPPPRSSSARASRRSG